MLHLQFANIKFSLDMILSYSMVIFCMQVSSFTTVSSNVLMSEKSGKEQSDSTDNNLLYKVFHTFSLIAL
jgi:hypothetical protein